MLMWRIWGEGRREEEFERRGEARGK